MQLPRQLFHYAIGFENGLVSCVYMSEANSQDRYIFQVAHMGRVAVTYERADGTGQNFVLHPGELPAVLPTIFRARTRDRIELLESERRLMASEHVDLGRRAA